MTPEKAAEILTTRANFMAAHLPNHPATLPGVQAEIEALRMGVAAIMNGNRVVAKLENNDGSTHYVTAREVKPKKGRKKRERKE